VLLRGFGIQRHHEALDALHRLVHALLRVEHGQHGVGRGFLVRSVSTDQGTTSLRTGSGAMGLLGLW
jgi:hypothetical protein